MEGEGFVYDTKKVNRLMGFIYFKNQGRGWLACAKVMRDMDEDNKRLYLYTLGMHNKDHGLI